MSSPRFVVILGMVGSALALMLCGFVMGIDTERAQAAARLRAYAEDGLAPMLVGETIVWAPTPHVSTQPCSTETLQVECHQGPATDETGPMESPVAVVSVSVDGTLACVH